MKIHVFNGLAPQMTVGREASRIVAAPAGTAGGLAR